MPLPKIVVLPLATYGEACVYRKRLICQERSGCSGCCIHEDAQQQENN